MARIYIVGLPGSGKSSISIGLANELNLNLYDLDAEIKKRYGTIENIFREKGEKVFRELERELLMETLFLEDVVVACGGGTPVHFGQMDWMNWNGITLYLKRYPASICAKIGSLAASRPMFLGLNEGEKVRKMEDLLAERQDFYDKSKIIFQNNQHFQNSLLFDIEEVSCKMRNFFY